MMLSNMFSAFDRLVWGWISCCAGLPHAPSANLTAKRDLLTGFLFNESLQGSM